MEKNKINGIGQNKFSKIVSLFSNPEVTNSRRLELLGENTQDDDKNEETTLHVSQGFKGHETVQQKINMWKAKLQPTPSSNVQSSPEIKKNTVKQPDKENTVQKSLNVQDKTKSTKSTKSTVSTVSTTKNGTSSKVTSSGKPQTKSVSNDEDSDNDVVVHSVNTSKQKNSVPTSKTNVKKTGKSVNVKVDVNDDVDDEDENVVDVVVEKDAIKINKSKKPVTPVRVVSKTKTTVKEIDV